MPKPGLSLQACTALGLRQDDLVATSDIIAGKNTAGVCSTLWSVASVCVDRCYKVRSHCQVHEPRTGCLSSYAKFMIWLHLRSP